MNIQTKLMEHIMQRQKAAERCGHSGLLPNDAIYFLRLQNIQEVCKQIELLATRTNSSLSEVLTKAIKPNLSELVSLYPYTSAAMDVIIRDFS